ncbi:hypothetical protein [Cyclobacterium xiamenense]|uniref:hypothetical protein n=1 Tax=Cyclobacterium xiamenense TaxID=1297121 RepID=UPI0035D07E97
MKRYINSLFILPLLVLSTVACNEDFLEPQPLSFFTTENVFVDRAGFEALLVTMRKDLTREQTAQKNFMAHQWAASEAGVPWLQMDFTALTPNSDRYQQFVTQINDIFRNGEERQRGHFPN